MVEREKRLLIFILVVLSLAIMGSEDNLCENADTASSLSCSLTNCAFCHPGFLYKSMEPLAVDSRDDGKRWKSLVKRHQKVVNVDSEN